jgi:hypothetical protein
MTETTRPYSREHTEEPPSGNEPAPTQTQSQTIGRLTQPTPSLPSPWDGLSPDRDLDEVERDLDRKLAELEEKKKQRADASERLAIKRRRIYQLEAELEGDHPLLPIGHEPDLVQPLPEATTRRIADPLLRATPVPIRPQEDDTSSLTSASWQQHLPRPSSHIRYKGKDLTEYIHFCTQMEAVFEEWDPSLKPYRVPYAIQHISSSSPASKLWLSWEAMQRAADKSFSRRGVKWNAFKDTLAEQFGDKPAQISTAEATMDSLRQNDDESVQSFYNRYSSTELQLVWLTGNRPNTSRFIRKLKKNIRRHLVGIASISVNEAYQRALSIEMNADDDDELTPTAARSVAVPQTPQRPTTYRSMQQPATPTATSALTPTTPSSYTSPSTQNSRSVVTPTPARVVQCYKCKKIGHYANNCPTSKSAPHTCGRCIELGHAPANCPEAKCYNCNRFGHFSRDCPDKATGPNGEPVLNARS